MKRDPQAFALGSLALAIARQARAVEGARHVARDQHSFHPHF